MESRKSKMITDPKDVDFIINTTPQEIEKLSFIMENFAPFDNKNEPRFHTYDLITIPAGVYGKPGKKNKKPFITTVGIFLLNRWLFEDKLFDLFLYLNESITKKKLGYLSDKISYAVMEDKITVQDLKDFLLKTQKMQPYSNLLCPSFSTKMLTMTKTLDKKKKELLEKNKEAIEKGDEVVVAQIEKELLDFSKQYLKDDPSMDIYGSGAKGSFGNNFKNLFVMRGAVKDPDPTKGYDVITSNYIDGVSKNDYVNVAKSLAAGPYSRALKTPLGGYWEKLFLRAFQHITLLPEGSDCGTKRTITITITNDIKSIVMYNYIVNSVGTLTELTSDNIDSYIGKTVKMRFSSLCESKNGICSKCAGNMFYRLGILNVGVVMPQVASRLKNISLKAFHDSQVKLYKINFKKAFKGLE